MPAPDDKPLMECDGFKLIRSSNKHLLVCKKHKSKTFIVNEMVAEAMIELQSEIDELHTK